MTAKSHSSRQLFGLAFALVGILGTAVFWGSRALADPVQIVPIEDPGGGGPPIACSTPTLGCWRQLANPAVGTVNMIALQTGKVMLMHRSFSDVFEKYQIFDPATNTFGAVQTATVPHNMYCTGFAQTASGNFLFAGSVNFGDENKATL